MILWFATFFIKGHKRLHHRSRFDSIYWPLVLVSYVLFTTLLFFPFQAYYRAQGLRLLLTYDDQQGMAQRNVWDYVAEAVRTEVANHVSFEDRSIILTWRIAVNLRRRLQAWIGRMSSPFRRTQRPRSITNETELAERVVIPAVDTKFARPIFRPNVYPSARLMGGID